MRFTRWIGQLGVVALVAAGLAAGSGGSPAVAGPVGWVSGDPVFEPISVRPDVVGVNYHGMWTENTDSVRAAILDRLAAAGVRSVRLDVSWDSLQPSGPDGYDLGGGVARLDTRLAEITARGMTATVMLYWAPRWATATGSGSKGEEPTAANYEKYGRILGWAANRWREQAPVWEMWNEPDLSTFWSSKDPNRFAEMIKVAYPVAKAASPSTTFVLGAPTYLGLGTGWFTKLYTAGIKGNYDAIAIHPYMSPSDLPPEGGSTGSARKWSIVGIADLRTLMAANNDHDTPLWATEFGWSAHPNTGTEAAWKKGVTETQQAEYTLRAYQLLAQHGIRAAYVYTDKDTPNSDTHEAKFGILNRDTNLTPKPAWYAVKCAATNICAPNPPTTPSKPTARATTADSVTLEWGPAEGALGYRVYRDGAQVAEVSDTGWTDTGLAPGSGHEWAVVAFNNAGASGMSEAVTATTPPADVSGLTVPVTTADSVTLAWGPAEGALSYRVYREGVQVAEVSDTGWTDTGLTPATTYSYSVRAVSGSVTGINPATVAATTGQGPLIDATTNWRFNDSGSNLGTKWRAAAYSDSGWKVGRTQVGYGDGDENTKTAPGKITYYLRAKFDVADPAKIDALDLDALIDDGAVVYVNGTEVWRFNLPGGTITSTTRASRYIAGDEEKRWRATGIPAGVLKAGTNVIAVEVHNDAPSSSDISFDLRLNPR